MLLLSLAPNSNKGSDHQDLLEAFSCSLLLLLDVCLLGNYRLQEAELNHQRQLAEAHEQSQQAAEELLEMHAQFCVYQASKAHEITSLEARLRQALQQTGMVPANALTGTARPSRAAGPTATVRRSEQLHVDTDEASLLDKSCIHVL